MQVLKDEVRKQILEVAEEMFYEKGYQETTTRSIAVKVGISVSNLYLYYENKEALFYAVTDSFYQSFISEFETFLNHEDNIEDMNQNISQIIKKIIIKDQRKFILIAEKSKGTKYESFCIRLIEEVKKHIIEQLNIQVGDKELLSFVFAKNFIEGIIIIAKEYRNVEHLDQNLKCLTDYHIEGIKQFIK